jgi:transposase-like protein
MSLDERYRSVKQYQIDSLSADTKRSILQRANDENIPLSEIAVQHGLNPATVRS